MASSYDSDFELWLNCVAINMAGAAAAVATLNRVVEEVDKPKRKYRVWARCDTHQLTNL